MNTEPLARTKSGLTLVHRVEPFDKIFGAPFPEDHPWAEIARGFGRKVHIAETGHTNRRRVHMIEISPCTKCTRKIPSTCNGPMRVTGNPLRATCRHCLMRWLSEQGWNGGKKLVDAIICWRVYGARFKRQLENGHVLYDHNLRTEFEDKNLPYAMRQHFRIVGVMAYNREQERRA